MGRERLRRVFIESLECGVSEEEGEKILEKEGLMIHGQNDCFISALIINQHTLYLFTPISALSKLSSIKFSGTKSTAPASNEMDLQNMAFILSVLL
jgi:hypothetical protein